MIGQTLSERYEITAELGRGGMGVVYRAQDTVLQRQVAVKVVGADALGTAGRARLLQEARAAASLNHPNIIAVYDAGEVSADQGTFIVMELVKGPTLRQYQPRSLDETLAIAREISAALAAAHEAGIIHRDLKPENVMLADDGPGGFAHVKLMDFGLARITGATRLTQGEALMGTIAYLAPELIMGQPASQRSDFYALGVMLYELTARRPPFEGDNVAVLLSNHLQAPVVPPSTYNDDLPGWLDALIVQLLAKDPEARPQSAAEIAERLNPVVVAREQPAEVTPSLLDGIARGRLVGREQELGEAVAVWRRAQSGDGRLLLISGEPGIGKTRLAQALVVQGEAAGARVLSGGCYEFEATTPYLPLAEALRDWVGRQSDQELADRLGSTAAELTRLAPEISARLADLPPNPPLSPQEERLRLFDNVARFLSDLAENDGLILFVDDLHWADQGTLSLISYLLRRLRQERLLVLATYREVELDRAHPLADALVQWNRDRLVTRLQLGRFDAAATNRLIATLFGQKRVSDEFAAAIHRETEGNPFFIEEVLKALIEQGQIYRAGDRWERKELGELTIPQSIKEAIGRRLNRLSHDCIDILHTAAIIGKDFPFGLLAEVAAADEDALFDALEEASAAQLIRAAAGETFIFTHDKIREVLYDEVLSIRRNRLHRRIAEALDRQSGPPPIEVLAYHYIAAGYLEKGLTYAQQAAEHAHQLSAFDEALRYYAQARECAVSLDELSAQAAIDEAMADIYLIIGPFDRAWELYEQALAASTDPVHATAIKVKMGSSMVHSGRPKGMTLLEETLPELDPEEQPLDVAMALSSLGRFHHIRAEYEQAIDYYQQARRLAEPLGDALVLSGIYAFLAGSYQHQALWDQSMHWAQACIDLGEANDYPNAVAIGHEFRAENYMMMGQYQEAFAAAQEDYRLGQKMGSQERMAWSLMVLGNADLRQNRVAAAAEQLAESLQLAEFSGNIRLEIIDRAFLSHVRTLEGNLEAALEQAERALARAREVAEPNLLGLAAIHVNDILLRLDRAAAAHDLIHPICQTLMASPVRSTSPPVMLAYARTLRALDRNDEALTAVDRAVTDARENSSQAWEAEGLVLRANLHAAADARERAHRDFADALAILDDINGLLAKSDLLLDRARWRLRWDRLQEAREDAENALVLFDASQRQLRRQELLELLAEARKKTS